MWSLLSFKLIRAETFHIKVVLTENKKEVRNFKKNDLGVINC